MSRKAQRLPWEFESLDHNRVSQIIPELDALKTVVEQNDWHNDNPFQQSLRLFDWVKRLPASLLEIIAVPKTALDTLLSSHVDQRPGHHTIHSLLAFAALIHDVGKAETFRQLPDGTTRCPDHEAAGARRALAICAHFDFSPIEIDLVTTLIGEHGDPYALYKQILDLPAPQQQQHIRRFEAGRSNYLQPLLLLACGDLLTSHLQTIRLEKYNGVLDFYRRWLDNVYRPRPNGISQYRRSNEADSD